MSSKSIKWMVRALMVHLLIMSLFRISLATANLLELVCKMKISGLRKHFFFFLIYCVVPLTMFQYNSVTVMSDSLQPHELQHTRPPCRSTTPRVHLNSCPLSQWCHPTISSSVIPFSSSFNLSQHQGLFKWINSFYQVAKVLEFQIQHWPFQWTPRTDLL